MRRELYQTRSAGGLSDNPDWLANGGYVANLEQGGESQRRV